jgi:alpha 1,3-glucosidase
MKNDPITLTVALTPASTASGELYVDDGDSFDYKTGDYLKVRFDYQGGSSRATLTSTVLHSSGGKGVTSSTVERVIVLGAPGPAKKCTTTCEGKAVELATTWTDGQLFVKKPNCAVSSSFNIDFEF